MSGNLRQSFLSLQARVTLVLTAIIFATVAVLSAISAYSAIQSSEQKIKEQSALLGRLLAENSAGSIRFGKADKLTPGFEALYNEANGSIEFVAAIDKEGKLITVFPAETGFAGAVGEIPEDLAGSFDDEPKEPTPIILPEIDDDIRCKRPVNKDNSIPAIPNWSHSEHGVEADRYCGAAQR